MPSSRPTSSTALPQNTRLENNCWMFGATNVSARPTRQGEPRNLMTMKKKERRDKMQMTKEAFATICKALTGSGKTQGSSVNDVCPSCGARVTSSRPSIPEIAVTTGGGCESGVKTWAGRGRAQAGGGFAFEAQTKTLSPVTGERVEGVGRCFSRPGRPWRAPSS